MTLTEWRLKISSVGEKALDSALNKADKLAGAFKHAQNSINGLKSKLDTLEASRGIATSYSEIRRLNTEIRTTQRELSRLENLPPESLFKRLFSLKGLLGDIRTTAIAAFSIFAVMGFGKEVYATTKKVEAYTNQLKFIAGEKQGMKDWDYLKNTSNTYGLDLESSADSYLKLAGSTRGTNLAGEKTKRIYEGISMAATVMHLTTEQTQGSILALSQMLSKGKVSAEELNGQLGERIPGALGIAARAMGMTEAKLMSLMQQGKVMSKDFVPRFAEQLRKEFAPGFDVASQSVQALENRMNNAMFELKERLGSDLKPLFIDILKLGIQLTEKFKIFVGWIKENWSAIKNLAEVTLVFVGTLKALFIIEKLSIAWREFTIATQAASAAQSLFSSSLLASNPMALIGAAAATTVFWLYKVVDGLNDIKKVQAAATLNAGDKNNLENSTIGLVNSRAEALKKGNDLEAIMAARKNAVLKVSGEINSALMDNQKALDKAVSSGANIDVIANLRRQKSLLNEQWEIIHKKGFMDKLASNPFKKTESSKNDPAAQAIQDTSAAINGGGKEVKQINITIGKFNDGGININTTSLKEGSAEVSKEMLNMFMRILQGAELTMSGN